LQDAGSSGHDVELRLELALPTKISAEEAAQLAESGTADPESCNEKDIVEQEQDSQKCQTLHVDVHEQDSDSIPEEPSPVEPTEVSNHVTVIEISGLPTESNLSDKNGVWKAAQFETPLTTEQELELLLMIENHEREKIIEKLAEAIEKERKSVERLQEILAENTT
jgi:hypothetical protein